MSVEILATADVKDTLSRPGQPGGLPRNIQKILTAKLESLEGKLEQKGNSRLYGIDLPQGYRAVFCLDGAMKPVLSYLGDHEGYMDFSNRHRNEAAKDMAAEIKSQPVTLPGGEATMSLDDFRDRFLNTIHARQNEERDESRNEGKTSADIARDAVLKIVSDIPFNVNADHHDARELLHILNHMDGNKISGSYRRAFARAGIGVNPDRIDNGMKSVLRDIAATIEDINNNQIANLDGAGLGDIRDERGLRIDMAFFLRDQERHDRLSRALERAAMEITDPAEHNKLRQMAVAIDIFDQSENLRQGHLADVEELLEVRAKSAAPRQPELPNRPPVI